MNIDYEVIDRQSWNKLYNLKNEWIFNATPIDINNQFNFLIDGRPFTTEGKSIALNQSMKQFKIYTGIDYDQ